MSHTETDNTDTPRSSRSARRPRFLVGIGLLLLGVIILGYPLLPAILYRLHRPSQNIPFHIDANTSVLLTTTLGHLPTVADKPLPGGNRLVIPRIGVNVPILEGANENVLDRGGVWHIPQTSSPDQIGNVVLSGHRWKYLPPSSLTLYLLDKVQDGDPILLTWQGKLYTYKVRGREIVTPDRTDILDTTTKPQLTIFTCTPLYSTSHRLVLYADLIS